MDEIVLTYIADPQTAVLALENGEIDYINRGRNPPLESLLMLKERPEITIKTRPDTRTFYIASAYWKDPFNGTKGILLRKAINYALDRNEMVAGAFFGYASPATDTMFLSPISPNVPECCYKGYNYDPEKAKQLLSEAGWNDTDGDGLLDKNGSSMKSLDLIITSSTDLIWMKDLAMMAQSQLKKVGIDINIRTLEWSAYQDASKNGDYDLAFWYNMGRTYPTTKQLMNFNLSNNKNHYGNQNGTLETIAYNARMATDEEKRDQYVCQICSILYDEVGVIPMVHPLEYAVMNKKVKGFEFGPNYTYDHIEECWIEE
jgi:peptide/nickel transport system substrate-binding protein